MPILKSRYLLLIFTVFFYLTPEARSHKKKIQEESEQTSGPAAPFAPGCELPFHKIAKKHIVDSACTIEGYSKNESSRLQNIAKNNFCANNKPIQISLKDFSILQEKADEKNIAHGRNHLPSSRGELAHLMELHGDKLGEGRVVQFTGFMIDPHYSDVKTGESVNCNHPGEASNDIHMGISDQVIDLPKGKAGKEERNKLLCETVVAEVTPHFRPEAWEAANLKRIASAHQPVRITGQLFFDGSHNPCRNGQVGKGDPARASLWEIHPVYNIEVCSVKKIGNCAKDKWVQLKDFW